MNYLQTTFRLLAAGVLAISGTTILLSSANAGSNTPKKPAVKPTELPTTPTKPVMPTTGMPASETPTVEADKVEADCDTQATLGGSSTEPSIAADSETAVSSTLPSASATKPSAQSGMNLGSLPTAAGQSKKTASVSATPDVAPLTGTAATAQAGNKPTSTKPCLPGTGKPEATPTSELKVPGSTPSDAPVKSGTSDAMPSGGATQLETPGSLSPTK